MGRDVEWSEDQSNAPTKDGANDKEQMQETRFSWREFQTIAISHLKTHHRGSKHRRCKPDQTQALLQSTRHAQITFSFTWILFFRLSISSRLWAVLRYFGEDWFDFDANPAFKFLTPGGKRNKRMRSGTTAQTIILSLLEYFSLDSL